VPRALTRRHWNKLSDTSTADSSQFLPQRQVLFFQGFLLISAFLSLFISLEMNKQFWTHVQVLEPYCRWNIGGGTSKTFEIQIVGSRTPEISFGADRTAEMKSKFSLWLI